MADVPRKNSATRYSATVVLEVNMSATGMLSSVITVIKEMKKALTEDLNDIFSLPFCFYIILLQTMPCYLTVVVALEAFT